MGSTRHAFVWPGVREGGCRSVRTDRRRIQHRFESETSVLSEGLVGRGSGRDVLEESGVGKRVEGGGLQPKTLCTENSPNQYFLLKIFSFPTVKSGPRGARGGVT